MGVYIKGMEMPKSCEDCSIKSWDCEGYVCPFSGIDTLNIGRQRDCPLVPVPPHGRLIDADALDTSILQAGFSYAITRRKLRYTPGEVREKIANAPTIIPAEEGE